MRGERLSIEDKAHLVDELMNCKELQEGNGIAADLLKSVF